MLKLISIYPYYLHMEIPSIFFKLLLLLFLKGRTDLWPVLSEIHCKTYWINPWQKNKVVLIASTFTFMEIECQGIHICFIVCLFDIHFSLSSFLFFRIWMRMMKSLWFRPVGIYVLPKTFTCHEPVSEMQCFRAQHHLNSQICSTDNGMGNHGHAFSGHLDTMHG